MEKLDGTKGGAGVLPRESSWTASDARSEGSSCLRSVPAYGVAEEATPPFAS